MNSFLAVLSGGLIAVMIFFNGDLSQLYGNPIATVIIHIVGLCCILPVLAVKRQWLPKGKKIPLALFTGGAVGVGLTYLNNFTIPRIGVTATLAIGLLGQMLTSLVIEQYGLFRTPRRAFNAKKLLVIALILGGIFAMGYGNLQMGLAIFLLALAAGVLNILSRMINADLALHVGPYQSTLINYVVGLLCALAAAAAVWLAGGLHTLPAFPGAARLPIYTGGALGVIIVILSNIVTTKVPALQLTLLLFVSQLGVGMLLDLFIQQAISLPMLLGGALVLAGLVYNQRLEKQMAPPESTTTGAEPPGQSKP